MRPFVRRTRCLRFQTLSGGIVRRLSLRSAFPHGKGRTNWPKSLPRHSFLYLRSRIVFWACPACRSSWNPWTWPLQPYASKLECNCLHSSVCRCLYKHILSGILQPCPCRYSRCRMQSWKPESGYPYFPEGLSEWLRSDCAGLCRTRLAGVSTVHLVFCRCFFVRWLLLLPVAPSFFHCGHLRSFLPLHIFGWEANLSLQFPFSSGLL